MPSYFSDGRQRRAERHGLSERPRHGQRIAGALDDGVERGAQPHQAGRAPPAHRAGRATRGPSLVAFGSEVEGTSDEPLTRSSSWSRPHERHQARMLFLRVQAVLRLVEHHPTAARRSRRAVTSSPRCAGRQCMKMASDLACFISALIDLVVRAAGCAGARQLGLCGSSSPIDTPGIGDDGNRRRVRWSLGDRGRW